MNGKTHMRRRLSVIALAASIAVVAVPAASAGSGYQAGLVPSKLGSQDPRETALESQTFSPSVVDRLVGSPDPRDSSVQSLNEPSMCAVHLYPCGTADGSLGNADVSSQRGQDQGGVRFPRADDETFREIIQVAAQEHGAAGFGNTTQVVSVLKAAPSVLAPDYSHLPSEDRP
jgi:hypothetical protein